MNAKASGKAALHCASVAGDLAVVKAILEFNPDLEIEVFPNTQSFNPQYYVDYFQFQS